MESHEIIAEYLKKEKEKKTEIEAINIDEHHKNIILAGIYQNIGAANTIKQDLNTLLKFQRVFEVLKPMIKLYAILMKDQKTTSYHS